MTAYLNRWKKVVGGKGLLKKNAIGNGITVPLLQDIGTRDSL